jgi:hypothetical protein
MQWTRVNPRPLACASVQVCGCQTRHVRSAFRFLRAAEPRQALTLLVDCYRCSSARRRANYAAASASQHDHRPVWVIPRVPGMQPYLPRITLFKRCCRLKPVLPCSAPWRPCCVKQLRQPRSHSLAGTSQLCSLPNGLRTGRRSGVIMPPKQPAAARLSAEVAREVHQLALLQLVVACRRVRTLVPVLVDRSTSWRCNAGLGRGGTSSGGASLLQCAHPWIPAFLFGVWTRLSAVSGRQSPQLQA